ncbi:MAG: CPBP family intramembrane metalloprotease [Leucobacter sp.]|nr:CPBP family intramembrane metalloprotease [Leucobacter sp.]
MTDLQNDQEIQTLGSLRQNRPDRFARVPWAAVVVFLLVSCGLAWLVASPLWLIDEQRPGYSALFTVVASAMMFTPAITTVVVVFVMKAPRGDRMRLLGIWPLRPAKRVVWFTVAALIAPLLLTIATVLVSVLCGWLTVDLVHLSGFQQLIDQQLASLGSEEAAATAAAAMPPLWLLVSLQLLMIPFGALFNSIFAFGEEIGWRGWLLPALRPLGLWPALLVSGLVWGLWHSPVILLGYNFGRTDLSGVAIMTVGCIFWGVLFGWVRLRSGSVWPAVIGHGALNASAGLFALVGAAGVEPEMALVNPLGVSGWVVIAVVVVILLVTGQFKREPQLAPKATGQPHTIDYP